MTFVTHTDGIGDVQLGGTYWLPLSHAPVGVLWSCQHSYGVHRMKDNTPKKENAKLGYTMQLGSGTVDLNPALTYSGKWEKLFWVRDRGNRTLL